MTCYADSRKMAGLKLMRDKGDCFYVVKTLYRSGIILEHARREVYALMVTESHAGCPGWYSEQMV